jgi:hypothetical protein
MGPILNVELERVRVQKESLAAISYGDSTKIARLELARKNQVLLTISSQDPNQLFVGVFWCRKYRGRPDAQSGD